MLLTWFSWRALFGLFLIVSLLVLLASTHTIQDVMPQNLSRLDWLSVVLAASFPALLYVLSQASNQGFSTTLLIILVIAGLAAIWFVTRLWHQPKPLLQLHVLQTGQFRLACLLTGISYIALIVTTVVMPLYFQTILKVTPLVSGLSLVPAAVSLALLNPRTGKLLDAVGPKRVVLIGMSLITIGFLLLMLLAGHLPLIGAILLACVTESGNAFVMMPAVTTGANALPKKNGSLMALR